MHCGLLLWVYGTLDEIFSHHGTRLARQLPSSVAFGPCSIRCVGVV